MAPGNMIEKIQKNKDLWNLYTRKEEYDSLYRDKWDRFAYYMSVERDIMRPKVSEYLLSKGMMPEYLDDKPFAVCLTHDIDGDISHEDRRTIRSGQNRQKPAGKEYIGSHPVRCPEKEKQMVEFFGHNSAGRKIQCEVQLLFHGLEKGGQYKSAYT